MTLPGLRHHCCPPPPPPPHHHHPRNTAGSSVAAAVGPPPQVLPRQPPQPRCPRLLCLKSPLPQSLQHPALQWLHHLPPLVALGQGRGEAHRPESRLRTSPHRPPPRLRAPLRQQLLAVTRAALARLPGGGARARWDLCGWRSCTFRAKMQPVSAPKKIPHARVPAALWSTCAWGSVCEWWSCTHADTRGAANLSSQDNSARARAGCIIEHVRAGSCADFGSAHGRWQPT